MQTQYTNISPFPTIPQWIEALRSGKYKQGKRYLRNGDDQFCCLGVYADMCTGLKWKKDSSLYMNHECYSSQSVDPDIDSQHSSTLTNTYARYIEKKAPLMKDRGYGGVCVLMNLNDMGKSFEDIANYIEEHYHRGEEEANV